MIRIATRASALAMWQAKHVAGLLTKLYPDLEVVEVVFSTKGDRVIDKPLADIGDKGLFTKELERALLCGEADLAVHSAKDVPSLEVPGLTLAAIPERGPSCDALVSRHYRRLEDLPHRAVVGTGSLRREALLLSMRPDLRIAPLRGNVPTRLARYDSEGWDAMILAVAGLFRLGQRERVAAELPLETFIPAVGQGALYVQAREGSEAAALLAGLDHPATKAAVLAERRFMARMEGGCQVPIGAYARTDGAGGLSMIGFVSDRGGRFMVRREAAGEERAPEALGDRLADLVIEGGGREALRAARGVPQDCGS